MDGEADVPIIPPKISGKVDASKLAQIIKSINSERDFVAYTFNYHELPKIQATKLEQLKSRGRSNSAALARRKSISLQRGSSIVGDVVAISEALPSNMSNAPVAQPKMLTAQFSPVMFNDDDIQDAPAVQRESPTISFSFPDDSDEKLSGRGPVTVREQVAPSPAPDLKAKIQVKKPTLVRANTEVGGGRRRAATYTTSKLSSNPVNEPSSVDEEEEALEQPTRLVKFGSKLRSLSFKFKNEENTNSAAPTNDEQAPISQPNSEFTTISSPSQSNYLSQSSDGSRSELQRDHSPETSSILKATFGKADEPEHPDDTPLSPLSAEAKEGLIFFAPMISPSDMHPAPKIQKGSLIDFSKRLSMVSPPDDESSQTFKEDSLLAKMDVKDMDMEAIIAWHETHRPPKAIRTVKFAFRSGTSSSVLDPATMFQDIHKVLISLPEFQEKKLCIKRHPDYYDFTCVFKPNNETESVKFDVEICKVWLLDVHAIKMKRRNGDAYVFKTFYEKIVKGLSW